MTRCFPLSTKGREAAQKTLLDYFYSQGIRPRFVERLTRDMLEAFMRARHQDEVMQRPWSQTTWLLANMEIGQCQDFYGKSLQLLRQRFPSARTLAKNAEMNFRCKSISLGGVRVTRMPDGLTCERDPLESPKVLELVSMAVGQRKPAATIHSTRGAGALGSNSKFMARRYLKNHRAQWRVYKEDGKIMLERLA